jgi:heme exporter protein CcmD
MNPRYALFVWSSYALALAVVLWNAWVPQLRRRQLKRQLSETLEQPAEADGEQAS